MSYIFLLILLVVVVLATLAALSLYARARAQSSPLVGGADHMKDLEKSPRSKSEATIIKYFEELCGDKFPTVVPDWLVWKGKKLELDGYNKKLKIAVEFSGPLHTKWYPEKEPYKKYFTRVVRDIVKKKLCKRRGVRLITVDVSLPPIHWRNYIASRLYDIGFIRDKPVEYIDEQTAVAYRNEQLEDEMGLAAEMKMVMALQ